LLLIYLFVKITQFQHLSGARLVEQRAPALLKRWTLGQCYHVDFGWFVQYWRRFAQFYGCFAHVRESYFARIICKPSPLQQSLYTERAISQNVLYVMWF